MLLADAMNVMRDRVTGPQYQVDLFTSLFFPFTKSFHLFDGSDIWNVTGHLSILSGFVFLILREAILRLATHLPCAVSVRTLLIIEVYMPVSDLHDIVGV
jgi:hypothetical protein